MHIPNLQMTLLVDDPARAVDFYCRVLGVFEDRGEGELRHRDIPAFQLTLATSQGGVGRQAGIIEAFMVIDVEDCEAMRQRLLEHGVRLAGEMQSTPYMRQLTCFDPFGNKVCLFEATATNLQRAM